MQDQLFASLVYLKSNLDDLYSAVGVLFINIIYLCGVFLKSFTNTRTVIRCRATSARYAFSRFLGDSNLSCRDILSLIRMKLLHSDEVAYCACNP